MTRREIIERAAGILAVVGVGAAVEAAPPALKVTTPTLPTGDVGELTSDATAGAWTDTKAPAYTTSPGGAWTGSPKTTTVELNTANMASIGVVHICDAPADRMLYRFCLPTSGGPYRFCGLLNDGAGMLRESVEVRGGEWVAVYSDRCEIGGVAYPYA